MKKEYKRQTREMPVAVRQKISQKMNGVPKTPEHCKHISDGLKASTGGYWSHIPRKKTPIETGEIV